VVLHLAISANFVPLSLNLEQLGGVYRTRFRAMSDE